jgi:hypothetical protein
LGAFVAISKSEIQRERVLVRTELADGLPLVRGDRIQLQGSCSARDSIVASFDEFSGRYYRDDATVAIVWEAIGPSSISGRGSEQGRPAPAPVYPVGDR